MDSNDSLKHILCCMMNPDTGEQDGPSREQTDSRAAPGDMYILHEEVNKWAKEVVEEMKKTAAEACGLLRLIKLPTDHRFLVGGCRLQPMLRAMEKYAGGHY